MSNPNTKITLFDIPTALPGRRPLSPHTSRVRYALNYKELAYKTEWLEQVEIEPFCKKHGYKPSGVRADGSPAYTLPIILDETSGSPVSVSDSLAIVEYLESTYPDPARPIFPSSNPANPAPALYLIANAYLNTTLLAQCFPAIIEDIYNNGVLDSDKEHWRKLLLGGKKIEEVAPKKGSEQYKAVLKATGEAFKTLSGFFEHNKGLGGTWILGEKPTFFDFSLLSTLMFIKLGSPEVWKEIEEACGGRWGKYVAGGEVYTKF